MAGLNPLAVVESIEVLSNYSPDFAIDVNAPSDPNASSEYLALVQKAQPMLKVNFLPQTGIAPVIIAPYGQPGPSQWPQIKLGAQVVGAVTAGITLYGIASLFLPRRK